MIKRLSLFYLQLHSSCTSSEREFNFLPKKRCFFLSTRFFPQQGLFQGLFTFFKEMFLAYISLYLQHVCVET